MSEKHWIEAFDALDFHHNFAVNNEIWPMLGYELALVEEWHADLPSNGSLADASSRHIADS